MPLQNERFAAAPFLPNPKGSRPVEACQPAESPRLGVAEAPPFGKGGFGQATDTGWVREVTNR